MNTLYFMWSLYSCAIRGLQEMRFFSFLFHVITYNLVWCAKIITILEIHVYIYNTAALYYLWLYCNRSSGLRPIWLLWLMFLFPLFPGFSVFVLVTVFVSSIKVMLMTASSGGLSSVCTMYKGDTYSVIWWSNMTQNAGI